MQINITADPARLDIGQALSKLGIGNALLRWFIFAVHAPRVEC